MTKVISMDLIDRFKYPNVAPYMSRAKARRRLPVPEHIEHVYLPLSVLESTSRIMRRFGEEGRECYAWWGGSFSSTGVAQVSTMFCPDIPTEFGRIELDRYVFAALHGELRNRDQVLIAELHTHPPGAGGQNEVDAAHPAATYKGFISIVVPNFAYPYLHDLRRCFVYSYVNQKEWIELTPEEIEAKFTIEDHTVLVRSR